MRNLLRYGVAQRSVLVHPFAAGTLLLRRHSRASACSRRLWYCVRSESAYPHLHRLLQPPSHSRTRTKRCVVCAASDDSNAHIHTRTHAHANARITNCSGLLPSASVACRLSFTIAPLSESESLISTTAPLNLLARSERRTSCTHTHTHSVECSHNVRAVGRQTRAMMMMEVSHHHALLNVRFFTDKHPRRSNIRN